MTKLTKLFEPITINGLYLPNRIIMPAMCTEYANSDGSVSQRMIDYYAVRAQGGVGLIIVEIPYIDKYSKAFPHMFGLYDDKLIPGLKKLSQAIHDNGGKAALQLAHVGRRASSKLTFAPAIGPSAIPAVGCEVPRELTASQVKDVIKSFDEAARRAVVSGFDAVEIHMAHGYIINQFLSPYSNHRTDEYGGSLENRARFAVEIVEAVRRTVGPSFPIFCKITGSEFVDEGIDMKMCKEYVRILEKAGIDAVTVSGGILESGEYIVQPMAVPRGCHVERAREVKKSAAIPVIAIGRINKPFLAEEILQNGDADMVAIGRGLIADPEFPKKALEMRFDDIRPCIACNQGCTDRLYKNVDISCLTNPLAGKEGEKAIEKAQESKTVAVIGGGPAGLTAASTAAKRGHNVILYDKQDKMGGLLQYAAVPPHKSEIAEFVKYLEHDARQSGVKIITNKEVTAFELENIKPDAVILATGSKPIIPKGFEPANYLTAEECLNGSGKVESPCVIIGGGLVGCETAHYLAEKGIEVTVLEMLDDFALDMGNRPRKMLLQKLLDLGVDMLSLAKVLKIGEDYLEIERYGLHQTIRDVKSVIMAAGYEANRSMELEAACQRLNIPYYSAGDCIKARKAIEAVHEGFEIGLEI